jgi:hypothetical protein
MDKREKVMFEEPQRFFRGKASIIGMGGKYIPKKTVEDQVNPRHHPKSYDETLKGLSWILAQSDLYCGKVQLCIICLSYWNVSPWRQELWEDIFPIVLRAVSGTK